jgi:hypothetical protein
MRTKALAQTTSGGRDAMDMVSEQTATEQATQGATRASAGPVIFPRCPS